MKSTHWAALVLVLSFFASGPAYGWVAETVDADVPARTGEVGVHTSIALDSSDRVHISYSSSNGYPDYDYDLRYATNASGAWITETVDSEGGEGSIVLDSSDYVHIAYNSAANHNLKYATNTSATWVLEAVDSSGDVGAYTAIALDSADKVHISYYDETNGDLKYATNASGTWVTATVDSDGDVGEYNSIAVDSTHKAHISYYDGTNGDLKYASNASGAWLTTTVDLVPSWSGNLGQYTSIALDSADKAHISYYHAGASALKYATNASGGWSKTIVDMLRAVGEYTSIALDSADRVHISYYDQDWREVKYATNASGGWIIYDVDWHGGKYTSIALDSADTPHITYYDTYDHALAYVTKTCSPFENCDNWVDDDCDGAVDEFDGECPGPTWTVPMAEATVYEPPSVTASNRFNVVHLLLFPMGAVVWLRFRRRKRTRSAERR